MDYKKTADKDKRGQNSEGLAALTSTAKTEQMVSEERINRRHATAYYCRLKFFEGKQQRALDEHETDRLWPAPQAYTFKDRHSLFFDLLQSDMPSPFTETILLVQLWKTTLLSRLGARNPAVTSIRLLKCPPQRISNNESTTRSQLRRHWPTSVAFTLEPWLYPCSS